MPVLVGFLTPEQGQQLDELLRRQGALSGVLAGIGGKEYVVTLTLPGRSVIGAQERPRVRAETPNEIEARSTPRADTELQSLIDGIPWQQESD